MTRQRPTWQPPDDELDGLARTLSVPELRASDAERLKTSLLASAAGMRQQSKHSRTPAFVGVGIGLAAAAAVLLWVGLPRDAEAPSRRAEVTAIGGASYVHEQGWPNYRIRVDQGAVAIDVVAAGTQELFNAATDDGRVGTRFAKVVVTAEARRLTSVEVQRGLVEVRYGGSTIILSAGQTWTPPVRTADLIHSDISAQPSVNSVPSTASSPRVATTDETSDVRPHKASPPRPHRVPVAQSTTERDVRPQPPNAMPKAEEKPSQPAAAPSVAKPGEVEFRAGIAALRTGDAVAATKSFTAACAAARYDALGEDACFWLGAAANRAGQVSTARDALVQFLAQFSGSARAGEAAALLGWLLYNAGELDAAESRFTDASKDRVPKVRESATRGLEAIKRQRALNR